MAQSEVSNNDLKIKLQVSKPLALGKNDLAKIIPVIQRRFKQSQEKVRKGYIV